MDPILLSSHGSSLGLSFGVQIWTQKWGQPSENFVADRGSFASRFCDALACSMSVGSRHALGLLMKSSVCVGIRVHAAGSQTRTRKTFAGSHRRIFRWLTAEVLQAQILRRSSMRSMSVGSTHALLSSHGSSLGLRFGVQIWTQKWGQPSENFVADRGSFASRFCDALA